MSNWRRKYWTLPPSAAWSAANGCRNRRLRPVATCRAHRSARRCRSWQNRLIVTAEPEGGYLLAIDPASFPGLEDEARPAEETELYNAILRDLSAGRIGELADGRRPAAPLRCLPQCSTKCPDKTFRRQSRRTRRWSAMADQAVCHRRRCGGEELRIPPVVRTACADAAGFSPRRAGHYIAAPFNGHPARDE